MCLLFSIFSYRLQSSAKDLYSILGLKQDATQEQIKDAFIKQSKEVRKLPRETFLQHLI